MIDESSDEIIIPMGESRRKLNQTQRLLEKQPYCCFCGGTTLATTGDHVPPKACFPNDGMPDGFEFSACEQCNRHSSKNDQIFGLYCMALDFEGVEEGRVDVAKFNRLRSGVENKYPGSVPDTNSFIPVHKSGSIITSQPIAFEGPTPKAFPEAVDQIGRKLVHALYYRECGKILTHDHWVMNACYQPQRSETVSLTEYLFGYLPERTVGNRPNMKSYGDNRFKYQWGLLPNEDFFMFAAQFGKGLVVWGMARGPSVAGIETVKPMGDLTWHKAGQQYPIPTEDH